MTVEIDFDALQADSGPEITLAENVHVQKAVTLEARSGFSDVGGVMLVAYVTLVRGNRNPSVTITVEGSDDGSSWSTVHSWQFTNSDKAIFRQDSPTDYLRVVCTPGGGLREAIVGSVTAVPLFLDATSSGGGGNGDGSSQPGLVWQNVATITYADVIAKAGDPCYFDLITLETGALVDSVWLHILESFDDPGSIDVRIGWDLAGTRREIDPNFQGLVNATGDDWDGAAGASDQTNQGLQIPFTNQTFDYGPLVLDSTAAGPLQAEFSSIAGTGTGGRVEVWIRTQAASVVGPSATGMSKWLGPCKVSAFDNQMFDSNGATSGTFTLTINGQTTTDIAYNADATAIQNALAALTSIGVGNVTVTQPFSSGADVGETVVKFAEGKATTILAATGDNLSNGFSVTPITGDENQNIIVNMITPNAGDIIEDFAHVVMTPFDGSTPILTYTDTPSAPNDNDAGWSNPSSSQGVGGIDLTNDDTAQFTNFYGVHDGTGVQDQPTSLMAIVAHWADAAADGSKSLYGNLPAVVRNSVPIYSVVQGLGGTTGEVWIWVKISTPAPLMD